MTFHSDESRAPTLDFVLYTRIPRIPCLPLQWVTRLHAWRAIPMSHAPACFACHSDESRTHMPCVPFWHSTYPHTLRAIAVSHAPAYHACHSDKSACPHALRTIPTSRPLYKSRRQNHVIITSFATLLAATLWTTICELWSTSRSCVVSLQVRNELPWVRCYMHPKQKIFSSEEGL